MSAPLVAPLPANANPDVAELATFFNETLGFCPNSVLTMQHRPGIARAFIELNKAVMANHGRVSSALKRLIGYVSSLATGCQYCQAHTMLAADRYGAAPEQMDHIWAYATHPAFSPAERAALDFAVAASAVPNAVERGHWPYALRQHWNEGEIVEMLGVISLFGFLNRWNDSMGTHLGSRGPWRLGQQRLAGHGWTPGKHG